MPKLLYSKPILVENDEGHVLGFTYKEVSVEQADSHDGEVDFGPIRAHSRTLSRQILQVIRSTRISGPLL